MSQARFDNSYARLGPTFGTSLAPTPLECARLIHCNQALLEELQMPAQLAEQLVLGHISEHSQPFAMVYAGHQFGGYSPQLGDGRGLLLGEWLLNGERYDLHLKGAGPTPYSRFGDGRAVLRSSIREYLASAALAALGVPTSRALALANSQQPVQREQWETGATLLRVSRCHIRFGHFEYFYHRGDTEALAQLIDYCAQRYLSLSADSTTQAQALLRLATESSAHMIAHWQAIGFAHGVMNTDNMSLIGETFDFGPFAFLDRFDPAFICNHSDTEGRYRFDRQPSVGLWNLNALAHALSGFVAIDHIRAILNQYSGLLRQHYQQLMMAKLGLQPCADADQQQLLTELLELLENQRPDYTQFFIALGQAPAEAAQQCQDKSAAKRWLKHYHEAQDKWATTRTRAQMERTNPHIILRNHHAQRVINAAERGDFSPLESYFRALQSPFELTANTEVWAEPPPANWVAQPISCSS